MPGARALQRLASPVSAIALLHQWGGGSLSLHMPWANRLRRRKRCVPKVRWRKSPISSARPGLWAAWQSFSRNCVPIGKGT